MSVARELLIEVVAELRRDPALARALRELLGADAQPSTSGAGLQRVSAWCRDLGVSPRLARQWITEGLPVVRRGRLAFVRVAEAEAWLASNGRTVERDGDEPIPSTVPSVTESDPIAAAAAKAAKRARRATA